MSLVDGLTIALFAGWCLSEVAISLLNAVNRLSRRARAEDRFSFLAIWLALILTLILVSTTWLSRGLSAPGAWGPLSGWLGCTCLVIGIAIRLAAVATLRRQYTAAVTIVSQHQIVDSGPYRCVRHPAYLGLLVSLLGLGLCSGNWVSLVVAIGLPLAAVMYRIDVEERALLQHFGPAYAEYASRTKRLLPGIF